MSALAPADRDRLSKLLGLLGSDFAGERDAAGLAAARLLRDRGITWAEAIGETYRRREVLGWRETVGGCLRQPGSLRRWERTFLGSLRDFPRLSPKQAHCLREIAERLGVAEGGR